ncbi:hypothetical protein GF380_00330, partial [Candidatus Uhrbacteria bacterium]|nr:hypothetical protein [Candidatus Uhrbacteria bacterium]
MERLTGEAVAQQRIYPALVWWLRRQPRASNVWVEVTDRMLESDAAVWLLYRGQRLSNVPDGYVVKIINTGATYTAELYRLNNMRTLLDSFSLGELTIVEGDRFGIEFSGTSHSVWYQPVGGAPIRLGLFSDTALTGPGHIGVGVFKPLKLAIIYRNASNNVKIHVTDNAIHDTPDWTDISGNIQTFVNGVVTVNTVAWQQGGSNPDSIYVAFRDADGSKVFWLSDAFSGGPYTWIDLSTLLPAGLRFAVDISGDRQPKPQANPDRTGEVVTLTQSTANGIKWYFAIFKDGAFITSCYSCDSFYHRCAWIGGDHVIGLARDSDGVPTLLKIPKDAALDHNLTTSIELTTGYRRCPFFVGITWSPNHTKHQVTTMLKDYYISPNRGAEEMNVFPDSDACVGSVLAKNEIGGQLNPEDDTGMSDALWDSLRFGLVPPFAPEQCSLRMNPSGAIFYYLYWDNVLTDVATRIELPESPVAGGLGPGHAASVGRIYIRLVAVDGLHVWEYTVDTAEWREVTGTLSVPSASNTEGKDID